MKIIIHTILITNRITNRKMYDEIYKSLAILSKHNGVNLYKHEQGYVTHALKDKGFTEIVLSKFKISEKYRHDYMQITIQLNPIKLLGRDIIELTKERDLKEVAHKFNKIVEEIHLDLNTFMYWTLNRIDYAMNITTPYVEEYIKLFQRADIPYRFKMQYDKVAKTRKQRKGSYYLISKSTIINFYDKFKERIDNTGKEVETAKYILRLEVQCLKSKTNAMKYKHSFEMKYLGYFWNEKFSLDNIKYYYDKTIGKGDYYKLDKAIEKVNSSNHTSGTKKKLIIVLKEINSNKSIWKARQCTIFSVERFNHYLKLIRQLNVNPVTIPRRWSINCLENLDSNIEY